MNLPLLLLTAYLIGGIPFGLILVKLIRGIDVRQLGSGSIGATNVLRTVGWKGGVLVLLLDAAKGLLPVLVAKMLLESPLAVVLVGLAAILGHTFSPFLRFTGGRGVATGLGVVLGLHWPAGLCALGLGVLLIALFRYVSLGSIIGAISLPFFIYATNQPKEYLVFTALVAILVVMRHAPNIKRLIAGTENRLGQKSTTDTFSGQQGHVDEE